MRDNTKSMGNVSTEKITIRTKAHTALNDLWAERTCAFGKPNYLPWVGAQAPCNSAAQDANMSLLQFERALYYACFVYDPDPVKCWSDMLKEQQAIKSVLDGKRNFKFVSTNGTNISFVIPEGRSWWTCAGKENMPDGEVYTSPLECSANGTFVASFPSVYEGNCVSNIKLVFREGKVVHFECSDGAFMQSMLDTDEGARFIGELAFGVNPRIVRSYGSIVFDEKIGGTFHIALGGAYSNTGGTNKSDIHWDLICDMRNVGTVYADGCAIQQFGNWAGEVRDAINSVRGE